MKTLLSRAALTLATSCLLSSASAEDITILYQLELALTDGSRIKAMPLDHGIKVNPRLGNPFELQWESVKELDFEAGPQSVAMKSTQDDRLAVALQETTLKMETLLGVLDIPVNSIRKIEVQHFSGEHHNAALGKPVHGQDGASHGKGLAKHLTDGDPTTHAKPPASHFDYRIDLQNGTDTTYHIEQIVLNWGYFGDYFKGIRAKGGEGWASASWPGEYVTSYAIEARKAGEQTWKAVHQHEGRPVDEDVPGVVVQKQELDGEGYSSISTTRITGLDLHGVAELRIRAKGGHWIGLFEFEAHGSVESR